MAKDIFTGIAVLALLIFLVIYLNKCQANSYEAENHL